MRKILFLFFTIFLLIPKVNAVSNESICLLDSETNTVLYQKNIHYQNLTASICKIATAIIAIENADLFDTVIIKQEDLSEGSSVYLQVGNKVLFIDLLYGLMLRSGNDCAQTIANHTFNDYNKFINEMNNLAKKLNLNNTIFENPSGLDSISKNYSTSYDMSILMSYCMKNNVFREITKTKSYKTNINYPVIWYQKHRLINNDSKYIGGKTGYTKLAGRTLISVYEVDGKEYICVTFRVSDDFNYHDYLFNNYIPKVKNKLIIEAQVLKQVIEGVDYYPQIKEDIYLPIISDNKITIKLLLHKKENDVCGKFYIYQDDLILYEGVLYVYEIDLDA